jgi:hypothetical protein
MGVPPAFGVRRLFASPAFGHVAAQGDAAAGRRTALTE